MANKPSKVWAQTVTRGTVFVAGSICADVTLDTSNSSTATVDGYDAYGEGFTVSVIANGEIEVSLNEVPARILFAEGVVRTLASNVAAGTVFKVVPEMQHGSTSHGSTDFKGVVKFHILDANNLHVNISAHERFDFIIVAQLGPQ